MNIVWKWIPRAAPQSITRSVMFVCILYSLFNLLSIIPPLVSNALELEQPIIRWCELGSEFLQFMGATNLANAVCFKYFEHCTIYLVHRNWSALP